MYHILFTHSSVDGHQSCSHFLATIINDAINSCVQVFVWTYVFIFLGYISRSGTVAIPCCCLSSFAPCQASGFELILDFVPGSLAWTPCSAQCPALCFHDVPRAAFALAGSHSIKLGKGNCLPQLCLPWQAPGLACGHC